MNPTNHSSDKKWGAWGATYQSKNNLKHKQSIK